MKVGQLPTREQPGAAQLPIPVAFGSVLGRHGFVGESRDCGVSRLNVWVRMCFRGKSVLGMFFCIVAVSARALTYSFLLFFVKASAGCS